MPIDQYAGKIYSGNGLEKIRETIEMGISLFKSRFGKDPTEFSSVEEVNSFVEGQIGRPLEMKKDHSDICSSRGAVLDIMKVSADEKIEEALSE